VELSSLTAKKLSQMLRAKECSATEILESVLQQISKREKDVGAYITITEEIARKQAKNVDEKFKKGEKLSNLAGIPIAVKDIICTEGILTTAASKILENFIPPYNATVVERLLENDMVITGKANLDEFAMGSTCEFSQLKLTRNPRDLERVPGGSSGGPAAAVAAHEAILALGSDTGGSIRVPAAFCGVVGLKPTYGAVSRYGVLALASSLDQVGPMGKTVEDVHMLFDAIAGEDSKDMTTFRNKKYKKEFDIKKLKVGIYKELFGERINPEIATSVMNVAKSLESHGAAIKTVSIPHMEYLMPLYHIIMTIEVASNLGRYDGIKYGYKAKDFEDVTEMYCRTREEGFGAEVKRRIILGTFLSSAQFGGAYRQKAFFFKQKLAEAYAKALEECDILISPTSATPAFKLGEAVDPIEMYTTDLCTVGANLASIPAISIPCGLIDNLPIGAQLIGPKYSEHFLFAVGEFYEGNCK
jgi:aspartyl-tRNA(Asn)/glutamyl-tRNA(Gln) amidotransferase subunit A